MNDDCCLYQYCSLQYRPVWPEIRGIWVSVIKAGHPTNESVTLSTVLLLSKCCVKLSLTSTLGISCFLKRDKRLQMYSIYIFTVNNESHRRRRWWLVGSNNLWPSVNTRCWADIQTFVIKTLQRFSAWMRDAVTKQIFDNWSFVKLPKNSLTQLHSLIFCCSLSHSKHYEAWNMKSVWFAIYNDSTSHKLVISNSINELIWRGQIVKRYNLY